jgi:sRNA-binding protein
MRADEERIMVEDLGSRGLVVGVVQADERVAKEGGEASARRFELGWRTWVANDRGQVGANLQFNVAGGVDDGRPSGFFHFR